MNQSRFLLKQVYKVKELDTLLKISETQIHNYTKIVKLDSAALDAYKQIESNNQERIILQGKQVDMSAAEIKRLNKALRRQKVYKWMAIAAGTVATAYLGIKYIRNSPGD